MSLSKKEYWVKAHNRALEYIDRGGSDGYKELLALSDSQPTQAVSYGFNAKLRIHRTLKSDRIVSDFTVSYTTYSFYWCDLLVASTPKGVCFLGFISSDMDVESILKKNFPKCKLVNCLEPIHLQLIAGLEQEGTFYLDVHLIGTSFQLAVWDKLSALVPTQYITYKELAESLHFGKAYQAIGSAVGMNPISLLIPCHQVLSGSKKLTGYRWGVDLKLTLLIGQSGI